MFDFYSLLGSSLTVLIVLVLLIVFILFKTALWCPTSRPWSSNGSENSTPSCTRGSTS